MKNTSQPHPLLLLSLLLPLAGCHTVSWSRYQPVDPPVYLAAPEQRAAVGHVTDHRPAAQPAAYYRHYKDRARYDRPVASIVREALATELTRAGFTPDLRHPKPDVLVDCELLDFRAVITESATSPSHLDLFIELRFRWIASGNQAVLEENVRRLTRRRVLGSSEAVALPFDAAQVRDFGQELLNDMLPRLIEKELNPWLAARLNSRPAPPAP